MREEQNRKLYLEIVHLDEFPYGGQNRVKLRVVKPRATEVAYVTDLWGRLIIFTSLLETEEELMRIEGQDVDAVLVVQTGESYTEEDFRETVAHLFETFNPSLKDQMEIRTVLYGEDNEG